MPKVSLFWEDLLAAFAFIAFLLGGALLPDIVPRNAPAAPEVTHTSPEVVAQPVLSFPIPYDATITQSGDGISEPRTRFYVRKSER